MRASFLGILLIFSLITSAQENVIFGFNANNTTRTVVFSDGSYALVSSSVEAAFVLRYNSCGDTLWHKVLFDGLPFNRLFGAQNDGTDLWIAAGIGQNLDSAVALIKFDQNGQVLISKSILAPINFVWYRLSLDGAGNLYLTGNSTATTGLANTVLKLNPQGQEMHAFQYTNSFIWGMSTAAKSGGLLNITGRTVYKLDVNGNVEWIKRYNGYYQSDIPPISLDDGYLIFGKYIGAIDRNVVFKIDLQGNLLWSSQVYLNINATDCKVAPDGHIHFLYTSYGPGALLWSVLELDENGNYLSTYILPKNTGDQIYSRDLNFLPNDRMLISGYIDFNFGGTSAQVFRIVPRNLNSLQSCPATLSSLSTEPSNVIEELNPPNFAPDRFGNFSIQNFSFSEKRVNLTLNLFCSPTDAAQIDLGPDREICFTDDSYLGVNFSPDDYELRWSNGENGDSILIDRSGWYWAEIQNPCGGEKLRDSIFISFFPKSNLEANYQPERPRLGESIEFIAKDYPGAVSWEFGDTIAFGNPVELLAQNSMSLGVIASYIDSNGCTVSDTLFPFFDEPQLVMPNAFSPNGDGLNDFFGPHPESVFEFEMQIFDRFGKRQANLKNQAWDGAEMMVGAYTYILRYRIQPQGEERIQRGIVNLIR